MTILAYHSISDREHPLAVTVDAFVRQLDALDGFEFVTVAEHARREFAGLPTRRCVALTFDDGYRDFADVVVPVLGDRRIPATVFVPTALLGGCLAVDDAGTGAPTDWPLMTWDDVREVASAGFDVGSHSATHPRLTGLDAGTLAREVGASKAELETRIARPVAGFCYPAGRHDARVLGAVAAAGYEWAVVTPRDRHAATGRLALRRVGVYRRDSLRRFRLKCSAAGRHVARARRALRHRS